MAIFLLRLITVKALFASANLSAVADCRGEFQGLPRQCSGGFIANPRHAPHTALVFHYSTPNR